MIRLIFLSEKFVLATHVFALLISVIRLEGESFFFEVVDIKSNKSAQFPSECRAATKGIYLIGQANSKLN